MLLFVLSDAWSHRVEMLRHKNKNAYINIIPYNEFPGSKYQRPCDEEIESFKNKLVSKKLKVMVRKTKGDDILAACGQLKS